MLISTRQIDTLLRFLPQVEAASSPAIWHQTNADGSLCMPYVEYPAWVVDLFATAGQDCWTDPDYTPAEAGGLVRDDAAIAVASLEAIKTMLTYCVRGERFSAGHWQAVLADGRMSAILKRLRQLR